MASSSKDTSAKIPKSKQDGTEDKLDDKSYEIPVVPTITLNNNKTIPVIGLGTKKLKNKCKEFICDAFKLGYRHIDCAPVYGNEKEIGEAIKEYIKKGGITREDIYITSKLWNTHHAANLVRRACESSMKSLGVKYLDCYIMHSPMSFKEGDDFFPRGEDNKVIFSDVEFIETWKAMEKLVHNGLVVTLGLANFNIRQINLLLEKARIRPALLHAECHPYLNQQILIDYCAANDIMLVANYCFGCPSTIHRVFNKVPLFYNPKIVEIAKKYNCTPAQVLIKYQIERGNIVVATAAKRNHMKDNLLSVNLKLSSQTMAEVDEMDNGTRVQTFDDCKGHPDHPYQKDIY